MEAESREMTINDHMPETIKEVLKFIYTGNVDNIDEENAEDLFKAADQYLLPGMKKICEKFIISLVTLENAIEMMAMGHMYRADELKKTAKMIIVEAG